MQTLTGTAQQDCGRVIIVEDEPLIALATQQALRRGGFVVLGAAGSGAEALSLFRQARAEGAAPDAVLMDIRLRGAMDGIEAACRIRNWDDDVAIVFLTANTEDSTRRVAASAQPDAFLSKLIAPRALCETLGSILRRRRESRQQRWAQAVG